MKLAKLVLTTTMILCLTLVVTAQLPQKNQPQRDPRQNLPITARAFQTRVNAFVTKLAAAPSPSGTPGTPNCFGQTVAALARQFGGLEAAALALGFSSVQELLDA